ncbi:hypothetical protein PYCCODRAFT_1356917 [Trametes coccinea BRFM310]|uniref:Uncharacterized protein n=1 Tax=Trametes coccinea (strain BRFM310) TaxID=1353009 RepID=A0A1Y2J542_TRAC3|nr:hypothetical protein PYCCODRAFT_1356917 [Trametes coccinea BRFM310]
MQPAEYYQIGGFRAHLRDNSNDALAAKLMDRDGAEFVLGIKPSGASYLLLPRDRFIAMRLGRPRDRPYSASEYESLSPVQYPTKLDLATKFAMLTSNKKATDGRPRDRSKANTAYTARGDGLSPDGIARSSFEHQRVLYRLCQNSIERPYDYALKLAPWFQEVRIFAFAFNTWASDSRSLDERQADPRVLDVGWTEFISPTDSDDLKPLSTSHYIVEEERYLSNPGRKKLVLPDVTQYMLRESIRNILQHVFNQGSSIPPKVVLVHDEKMTRCVLQSFGVDTSGWEIGIKALLYHPNAGGGSTLPQAHDSKTDFRGWPGYRSRERSLSPRRRRVAEPKARPRSPPAPQRPPPAYIVDVRQMYQTMMQIPARDDSILMTAKALAVRDTAPVRGEDDQPIYEDVDPSLWWRRLLGYMWEDMANSIAIDEQRALRQRFSKEEPIDSYPVASDSTRQAEEYDPNDMVQPSAQRGAQGKAFKPVEMFDSEDEDDDW